MWKGLWDAIEHATTRPVKFKFMHGSGLLSVVLDGDKAQVLGLGDALLLHKLNTSFVEETSPEMIVRHIVRLCSMHLDRYVSNPQLKPLLTGFVGRTFTKLAANVQDDDVMERVRRVTSLKTWEELRRFGEWCEGSEQSKALHGTPDPLCVFVSLDNTANRLVCR